MNLIEQTRPADWLPTDHDGRAERLAQRRRSSGLWATVGGRREILRLLRRNGIGLLAWLAVLLVVAGLYLVRTAPQYTASSQIVLEPGRSTAMVSDTGSAPLATLDSAQADSQVQVIKSERNLRFVFDTLDLKDNPAFFPAPPGLLARLLGKGQRAALPDDGFDAERAIAFQNFSDRVGVRRVAQSYVLEISYLAGSASEAARLTNAITAAYIRDQIQFKAASVPRGTQFLQGRVSDLKMEEDAATEAVKTGIIPEISFADADARVVSAALPPLAQSYPQSKLVLAFAAAFGLLSGLGWVALRHSLDRIVRSRGQVMQGLGVDLIAALPQVGRARSRTVDRGRQMLRVATDDPFSVFAQAMRNLRAALFHTHGKARHLAIGVVSCSPGEGRSTVAANLAFLLAASSEETMLVDGDLQHYDLTLALAPEAAVGLTSVLLGHSGDPMFPAIPLARDLSFVPAVSAGQPRDPNVFVGSATMQRMLTRARESSHVIVDLPPMSLSSDAQAIGSLLDGVILLAEVDRTTLDEVEEALRILHSADVSVMGVVLNKDHTYMETRQPL